MTASPLFSNRLLACLRVPSTEDDSSLERVEGGFRSPAGIFFPDRDDVPSLYVPPPAERLDRVTREIKNHYETYPFPSYEGLEEFGSIVSRGLGNRFTRSLLAAIGYNKLILECGCGTGQLTNFLTLNNNHVLGIDLSIASLKLALEHKLRNGLSRAAFAQMDVFDMGIKDESFDVVISSGVLHHTKDSRAAFGAMIRKVKPGGIVIVGLYNRYARLGTWGRAKIIRMLGPNIDYVVRKRVHDSRKAEAWIKDQYFNPHETWHSVDEVLSWFRAYNITYVGCHPAILGTAGETSEKMFEVTEPGTYYQRILTQVSWLATIGREGALFEMIGKRNV